MDAKQILAATAVVCAGASPAAAKDRLVGVWRLERYVDEIEGHAPVYQLGEQPIGMMIFTADHHISINFMRNPVAAESTSAYDENACNPSWYCSQFGTYTVDKSNGTFTIQVTGSNIPAFMSAPQVRPFAFKDGKLVIAGEYEADGKRARFERVFVRE
jgi:hypothetical protein